MKNQSIKVKQSEIEFKQKLVRQQADDENLFIPKK